MASLFSPRLLGGIVCAVAVSGCIVDQRVTRDPAETRDAMPADAGPAADLGASDAAHFDAAPPDAAPGRDAGFPDAARPDAVVPDAGPFDAARPDADVPDAAPCGAHELCGDGQDDDCDGLADEGCRLGASALSVATNHTCALLADGRARCWATPDVWGAAPPDEAFVQVVAGRTDANGPDGGGYTCGLRARGDVLCWGLPQVLPAVAAPPGVRFTALDAGTSLCALDEAGAIRCWASDPTYAFDADDVPQGGGFTAVSVGWRHACALDAGGRPVCWSASPRLSPAAQPPPGLVLDRVDAGSGHTCGLTPAGEAHCWGANDAGQSDPPGDARFAAIGVGDGFTCGLGVDGALRCWGAAAPPAGRFASLAVGPRHACALDEAGEPVCWGRGGASFAHPMPGRWRHLDIADVGGCACLVGADGRVACVDGCQQPPEGRFTKVELAQTGGCGLLEDGGLRCWGDPEHGLLDPPAGAFTELAVGNGHGCAIDAGGAVRCWGRDDRGQATAPPGRFVRLDAGHRRTCGVGADGAGRCWGESPLAAAPGLVDLRVGPMRYAIGVAADGRLLRWEGAVALDAVEGPFAGAVAVGGYSERKHVCALEADGRPRCFWDGQALEPDPDAPDEPFALVRTDAAQSCGLRRDGRLRCWRGALH